MPADPPACSWHAPTQVEESARKLARVRQRVLALQGQVRVHQRCMVCLPSLAGACGGGATTGALLLAVRCCGYLACRLADWRCYNTSVAGIDD